MILLLKTIYRLFKYKAQWRKQFRELNIRKEQKASIRNLDPKSEHLILFFIPGADYFTGKENISGGLISIVSLAQETTKIFEGGDTKILCSTYYGDHLIYKLTSFENETVILNPNLIESYFKHVKSIILHIPELFVEDFVLKHLNKRWIGRIENIHINIMNQNIELMPSVDVIRNLSNRFSNCTITTAHKKYCTLDLWFKYKVPIHQLSVWISPENYTNIDYSEKKNVILFSPDNQSLSEQVIDYLQIKYDSYRYQIISGLTYEAYKELISKAKFVITTGEGLDAYFIETYFSGGIAFAIKNLNFFDVKYLKLPCLFNDLDAIENQIEKLIVAFDNPENYKALNLNVYKLLSQDYSYHTYLENLKKFYKKEYTYA